MALNRDTVCVGYIGLHATAPTHPALPEDVQAITALLNATPQIALAHLLL